MSNAPQHIIDLLEEGLQASRMKTASFPAYDTGLSSDEFTEQIREQTRLYRETWVEQPLLVVLAYLKGDIDARQAERLWLKDEQRRIDEDVKDPRIALGLVGANENFEVR